jgi:hypothetical protein
MKKILDLLDDFYGLTVELRKVALVLTFLPIYLLMIFGGLKLTGLMTNVFDP